jgi:hypothetical protein
MRRSILTENRRYRRAEASEYIRSVWGLSYSVNTLAKLATIGGGPAFEHFGRWPVYTSQSLDDWVRGRLSRPKNSTSDRAG